MTTQTTLPAGSEAVSETLPKDIPSHPTDLDIGGPSGEPQSPAPQPPAAETKEVEKQDTQPTEAKDDAEPKRNRVPASVRIAQLTGRTKVAEARLQEAMQEIETLRGRLQPPKDPEALSYDERESLRLSQALDRRDAERLQSTIERAQSEAHENRAALFMAQVEEAGDAMPKGFVEQFEKVPVTPAMADFIGESEKAPLVALHLLNNPDLSARLARDTWGPRSTAETRARAMRELARIEASVSAPAPRKATQAPNPGTTLNGGQPPPPMPSLEDDEDMASYSARRQAAWKSGKP